MYTLEKCSYYEKKNIQGKPIYIFESHNMALPVWGSYAAELGPLNLITFDSHTDTHPAFNKFLKNNTRQADYQWRRTVQFPEVKKLLAGMHYRREDFSFEDIFKYSFDIYVSA